MITKNGVEEDVKRTLNLVNDRRKKIDEAPATPLPKTYAVNELAKKLHPGYTLATVQNIEDLTYNSKLITLKAKEFPYFRGGQYITITSKIDGKLITRPYSIFSSPKESTKGILQLGVQNSGFFSSHLNYSLKPGDKVLVGEPSGDFYHDDIRDHKHILAIAGGSGITPFVSMAKAILEGSEDFNLTILYGVKTRNDFMIDIKKFNSPKIKIVPILSNEEVKGYEHGFINKDIIKKYLTKDTSIFMCGASMMYSFVKVELLSLGLDLNTVRSEHNCIPNRKVDNVEVYKLTVHLRGKVVTINARNDETLLVAMERAGLCAPSRCRSGFCGYCHSRLVKGEYFVPVEHDHRRMADKKFGFIHPCATYPLSDIEIDVPPVDEMEVL